MKTPLPKISFIILTFNGGELLRSCLKSIRSQDYPQELVEIVTVDDASSDNSVEISEDYGAKVYISGKRDMYLSWGIALHKITGEYTYMVDQDIELRGKDFITKMVKPMLEDKEISGSFTRAYPRSDQPWITRFISYHPFQCDPLYEYLTPPVEGTYLIEKEGYIKCDFQLGKIPAESRVMYRVNVLKKTPNWKMERIFDHDLLIKTIKEGFDKYAYVPSAGIFHHHAKNLKHLLNKRLRNIDMHYFPYQEELEYKWLDTSSKKSVLRMVFWVIYANLFLPATVRGFIRFLKHRDWALLMEPIVTIATTDVIIWGFLTHSVGQELIRKSLKTLLNSKRIKAGGAFGR